MVSIRLRLLLRRDVGYSTSDTFRSSNSRHGERQQARDGVSRPPGNGPARANPQRELGVVSIRPTELLRRRSAYSTSETHRYSTSETYRYSARGTLRWGSVVLLVHQT
jgi:hypothetical protein